ncbi:TonB-dependent receptor [Tsuneonella flava]|uniref:TonB-dependent receptor n=1 Tax=Tsuneonella flava TaxID=2055955 RepID=A0ABX7K7T6_9SPHN|nr:TonB-dependent receptor [Tsuneonella flava]QSB44295.1 TonB-dependent receptor [Tsuneonella flava]
MKKRLFLTTCTLAMSAVYAAPTFAQDATNGHSQDSQQGASSAGASETDAIVVTGSRIRRSDATSAIPLKILGREDISESGTTSIAEIVQEIPGVDSDISPESSNTSVQNSGISSVNLRRLGSNRTLTLIDGRRAISNAGNGERVSLSTIPAGFVESIEVTTGGASAIYGSDAIAGVVNIILKKDWEGFEANLRYLAPERSGDNEIDADLTWGKNFANGRGNILVGASFEHQRAIYADSTRPESIAALTWDTPGYAGAFNDESVFPGCESGGYCFTPSLSSYLPGGRFESDDAWNIGGVWYNDKSLLPDDGRPASAGFETYPDGFNYRPGQTLSPEYLMASGAVKLEYELTPSVNVSASVMYTYNYTRARNSSEAAIYGDEYARLDANGNALRDSNGNVIYGELPQIAANNPFIPDAVEETRSGTVSWYRRFAELGWDEKINFRDTLRSSLALNGSAWGDWQWQVSGTYGTYKQHQRDTNEINLQNLAYALVVESDGAGGYQCVDATARSQGCVPIDLFGENSITDDMANYIRYNANLYQKREQITGLASANGTVLQLPGGPLKAAAGLEYRREYQKTWGQDGDVIMATTSTGVPDIEAHFDVVEAFAELDIPITSRLSLQLAGRAADYSTVGGVFSYNAGGSWSPSSSIRFRAQYSRSQRAPTLTEFFSPPRGDYDSVRDPCDGLMPDGSGVTAPAGSNTSTAVLAANCLAVPGIQAYFADPANAGQPFEFDGSIRGPNQGNNKLKEETADTYTAGVVLTPKIIPGLSLIADYYQIRVRDAIGSISSQLTADLCYTADNYPDNRFCDVISRNSQTGTISQIINQVENLDSYLTEGVDVTFNYDWAISGIPGRFGANLIYTHYFRDEFTYQGIAGLETEDSLGEIGKPTDEFRLKLGWSDRNIRISWTTLYRSGGVDDNHVAPTDSEYFKVGGQAYHNLYMSYTLRNRPHIKIYGGVNNVFNDLGPFIPSGLNYGSSRNIVSALNDLDGREFYVGARFRF